MVAVKKIAIVGATGTIGKFIVEELLKTGKHELTAITRADSKAVIPAGLKVAKVNYDDPSTLVAALRGQDVLIITLAPMAPRDTSLKLVEAAAEAGVPYVIPNGWGLDPSHPSSDETFLGPGHREVIKKIEELGKSSWIHFVSGFWYEFSLGGSADGFGFDFQNRSVIFFDDGKTRINTSTWDQTGRAVAKLLSLPEQGGALSLASFKNKFLYISSFFVSQKDMFESVLRVTGAKESDWKISYEKSSGRYQAALAAMKQGDRKAFRRAMYVRAFYPEGDGNGSSAFEPLHGLYNDALGLPKENLDERTKIAADKGAGILGSY
ncbi:CipA protein [Xylariaceae sp. FL0662B]|nr:CipA protein [Xylariaceae sp. FL0662B]